MNISIFKTYVITVESIEICKELIEKELSIVFTAHESSYFGDYFKSFFLNAHLNLAPNYNEMEADWTVPTFKRFNTILKISITSGKKNFFYHFIKQYLYYMQPTVEQHPF